MTATKIKAATPPAPPPPGGKLGTMLALLQRPAGATLSQLTTATAWQRHSIRGALAGALKKRGIAVTSSKEKGAERVYRVAPGPKVKP